MNHPSDHPDTMNATAKETMMHTTQIQEIQRKIETKEIIAQAATTP